MGSRHPRNHRLNLRAPLYCPFHSLCLAKPKRVFTAGGTKDSGEAPQPGIGNLWDPLSWRDPAAAQAAIVEKAVAGHPAFPSRKTAGGIHPEIYEPTPKEGKSLYQIFSQVCIMPA